MSFLCQAAAASDSHHSSALLLGETLQTERCQYILFMSNVSSGTQMAPSLYNDTISPLVEETGSIRPETSASSGADRLSLHSFEPVQERRSEAAVSRMMEEFTQQYQVPKIQHWHFTFVNHRYE